VVLACRIPGGNRIERRQKNDHVTGAAPDQRPVLAEERPGDDVLERDDESRLEVHVGRGGRQSIPEV
jgi:hypothetical protein